MAKSPLFGRRIHIAGRIADDLEVAPTENVRRARELVVGLVKDLIKKGATFVVPVDAEPLRSGDEIPLCFDWLVWETIRKNVAERPAGSPNPMIVAVQHHKSEEKIPEQYINLWDGLRDTDLVKIENAAHWNMASKRMEVQARWGDILITLGGGEAITHPHFWAEFRVFRPGCRGLSERGLRPLALLYRRSCAHPLRLGRPTWRDSRL